MNGKTLIDGLKVAGCLYVAALLQSGASYRMDVFGARPDFLLLCGMVLPLVFRPKQGAIIGFFAGVLHGWVTGVSLTVYALVRMVFGYGISRIGKSGYAIDLKVAWAIVTVGSLLSQLIILLLAPPADKGAYIRATIGTALYNGVLALPFFLIARRVFEPQDD